MGALDTSTFDIVLAAPEWLEGRGLDGVDSSNSFIIELVDPATVFHVYAPGDGGVPEAPTDGKVYARRDRAWVEDSVYQEAPVDGTLYVRKNGAWERLSVAPGGIVSVVAGDNVTVDNTDPQNPVISASGREPDYVTIGVNQDNELYVMAVDDGTW